MTGAKFRNWLMVWLFHKAQLFNFKEKTLPLESVSWDGMKSFLNYAKKMWLQHILLPKISKSVCNLKLKTKYF